MDRLAVTIDDQGAFERVRRAMEAMPEQVEKARKRALRKLLTWVRRQVLRAVASAAGMTQKAFKAVLRYNLETQDDGSIKIWIGTNPVQAHYLGTVRWTRRMKGARVGRRLFEHAWSWGPGSKTKTLVMRRRGEGRLPIDPVTIEIHEAVSRRVEEMLPAISERFERLLMQELNYALQVEAAR